MLLNRTVKKSYNLRRLPSYQHNILSKERNFGFGEVFKAWLLRSAAAAARLRQVTEKATNINLGITQNA